MDINTNDTKIVDKAIESGKAENSPDRIIVRDSDCNVDHNEFECDDIEGVHDWDSQHNLCPNQIDNKDWQWGVTQHKNFMLDWEL